MGIRVKNARNYSRIMFIFKQWELIDSVISSAANELSHNTYGAVQVYKLHT